MCFLIFPCSAGGQRPRPPAAPLRTRVSTEPHLRCRPLCAHVALLSLTLSCFCLSNVTFPVPLCCRPGPCVTVAASLASAHWVPVAHPPPHASSQRPKPSLDTACCSGGTPNHAWTRPATLNQMKPKWDRNLGSLVTSSQGRSLSLPWLASTAVEWARCGVPRPPHGNVAEPLKERPAPQWCL